MKQFFISFLGALAGIWVSVILGGILMILCVAVLAVSGASESQPGEIRHNSVLCLDLSGEVTDRAEPVNIMNEIYGESVNSIPLNDVIAALRHAAADKDIDGAVIFCNGASAGLAQSQAIIDALAEFKQSGKWVYAYGDTYTQGNYFIASVADSLFVNPAGIIDIHGLSATTPYFKGLLDKLGVEVQVVKVGTYKSAVEPFILKESSEANRRQQLHYLSSLWSSVSSTIAAGRGVDTLAVNRWADSYSFSIDAAGYVADSIADRTLYRHEFDELVVERSGLDSDDSPRYVSIADYVKARTLSAYGFNKGKRRIAVLYALGDIVESGNGGIVSDELVPRILDLADDDDIDGLILRVNSGGGSAYASEQIWEALEQFKQRTGKPFYVSMGDMAASGGYYISCGADRIYADPLTLTGSIGIFGLIPDASKLLNDKIGITTSTVETNSGSFPTFTQPMPEAQRAAMQTMVNRGYELFVSRCADGRHMPVDSIKAIAEGRVWDGYTACRIGLVDRLGGLLDAINDMAQEIGAAEGEFQIREYPKLKFKWWEEMLTLGKNMKASMVRSELGEMAPLYDAAMQLKAIDPIQCRVEYQVIR